MPHILSFLCQRCAILMLVAGALVTASAQTYYYPKGTNLASLSIMTQSGLTTPQKIMAATLQGLVARRSPSQIYINVSGGHSIWHNHIKNIYGVPATNAASVWNLLSANKNLIDGYILYDLTANSNSLSAAVSLAGLSNAIAVDKSFEATVRSYGVTQMVADVSARDEKWVWTNCFARLNHGLVVEQKESYGMHLRDYSAMANAFTFYDGNSSFRSAVMNAMDPNASCFGWGDASGGEDDFVGPSSTAGVYTVPSDWALNLSTLSSIRDLSVNQRNWAVPAAEQGVHYVTFLITDGDNVQYNLGGQPAYYNNAARGSFNMGWALSPSLADLAPSVLRWYFDSASNAPGADFFVSGPSGCGYMYPSYFPASDLNAHTVRLNEFMTRADLSIVQILDFNAFTRTDLWDKYLAQPAIDALLYLEYSKYSKKAGALYFSSNGKLVASARDMLWAGLEEETNVIANINSYPRDVSSPEAYTLVSVHVWDKTLDAVKTVVTNLNNSVRVVTPHAFTRLIRENVGRCLNYEFSVSLQGWAGATSGKTLDKAQYSSSGGNPGGRLVLDGSDYGARDTNPNSWFSRQILLPANALSLAFDTSAANDGLLRVRLKRPDGVFVTLLDWSGVSPANTWAAKTASISAYSGQCVTLYFEQNDGGLGSGEYRYLDNVRILTSGSPVWLPDAPKLVSATDGFKVNVGWRPNGSNQTSFVIERSLEGSGIWAQLASVPGETTHFTDTPGTGCSWSYRVKAFNTAGVSEALNTRSVAVPPVPALEIVSGSGGFQISWPNWATNLSLCYTTYLSAESSWSVVPYPVVDSGGKFTVSMPADDLSRRYFRLQLQ